MWSFLWSICHDIHTGSIIFKNSNGNGKRSVFVYSRVSSDSQQNICYVRRKGFLSRLFCISDWHHNLSWECLFYFHKAQRVCEIEPSRRVPEMVYWFLVRQYQLDVSDCCLSIRYDKEENAGSKSSNSKKIISSLYELPRTDFSYVE